MARTVIAYVLLSLWFMWRPDYGALIVTAWRSARWLFTHSWLLQWWWPAFLGIAWAVLVLRVLIAARRGTPCPPPRAAAARTLSISAGSRRWQAFWEGFTDLAVFARQRVAVSATGPEALHAAYNLLGPPPDTYLRDLSGNPGDPSQPPVPNGGRRPQGEIHE
jgi:hypothetical protein